jgi:dipeptidyl aminopeptidase
MVGSNAAYLDILPNDEGYNHIALFSPADSSIPKWLTSGPWEVTSGVLGVDVDKSDRVRVDTWRLGSEASFLTDPSVTSLQLLLPRSSATCTRPLFQTSRTSRGTGRTNGPHGFLASVLLFCELLSTERVLRTKLPGSKHPASASHRSRQQRSVSSSLRVPVHKTTCANRGLDFQYTLTDNKELNETSSQFQMPTIIRQTIMSDGYGIPWLLCNFRRFEKLTNSGCTELNAMEIRPPAMDDSGRTKYPVLFRV